MLCAMMNPKPTVYHRSTMIEPEDRKLDCRIIHDPRSRDWRMGSVLQIKPQRSRRWACKYRLDQGQQGACVGFAGAHQIGAAPMQQHTSWDHAVLYYHGAQKFDQWPGEKDEGSSVLGLMKFWKSQNIISEYRWCITFREVIQALSEHGPLNIGTPWPSGMNRPDHDGQVRYEGETKSAHSVILDELDMERERIWILNSWGRRWGVDGRAWMTFADVRKMMGARATFALPSERKLPQAEPEPKRWWQFWKWL